jgi:hypothetical protein
MVAAFVPPGVRAMLQQIETTTTFRRTVATVTVVGVVVGRMGCFDTRRPSP